MNKEEAIRKNVHAVTGHGNGMDFSCITPCNFERIVIELTLYRHFISIPLYLLSFGKCCGVAVYGL